MVALVGFVLVPARLLLGPGAYALRDRVICDSKSHVKDASSDERALREMLLNHSNALKQVPDLAWTGHVFDAYLQTHVYHRVVSSLARTRQAQGRETIVCEVRPAVCKVKVHLGPRDPRQSCQRLPLPPLAMGATDGIQRRTLGDALLAVAPFGSLLRLGVG